MLILLVIGAKGGVGATTLSIDLAKRYAQHAATLMVDGDLSGRRSGAALFNCFAALDEHRAVDGFGLAAVGPNLSLLEMASSIHEGFTIKSDRIDEFFSTSAQYSQALIVDAPQPFAAAVRPFAVRATGMVILVEPTLLGVTGARAMQLELQKFGVPSHRMRFVLSMTHPKPEVSRANVERALGVQMIGEIPPKDDRRYDKAVSALMTALEGLPPSEVLVLRPSASTPLGERRLGARKPDGTPNGPSDQRAPAPRRTARDDLKNQIHQELSRRIDFAAVAAADQLRAEELRAEVETAVSQLIASHKDVGSAEEIAQLRQEIFDEALGLGPLEDLMRDTAISEIMVCGPRKIYIEREGRIEKTTKHFVDERQLRLVIERIISPLGRRIDEAVPMVDARLPDGSRVNATIEPLTIDGSTITIRRFGKRRLNIEDLINRGSMMPVMADFLRACVEARLNIVISGGTGSGKTTMLNVLSHFLPTSERIITIEDAAELYLDQEHVVRMEARPANVEGHGEIRIRDLVKNALRMRPDRIVVGECRGGEALDMLQAMNTGHDGSLTTVHANTPRDCLSRIETMVLMAGYDIPVRAIREQIVSAVDVVIQVARMRDGSRKITSISEVVGLEGDVVSMMELVRFQQHGVNKEGESEGNFVFTGVQPVSMQRFAEYGVTFDLTRMSEMQLAVAY
ncbi:MAG TPA: ATPase, T2SS/T4P/T4SS family [Candidatus Baltobacteraceae bacterium]|jgi:pilus assembly protein CpaF|nr:ATPase, T2SS/T4P/T4SS family [Candidatus Baltobacteraceae bacterium]